MTSKMNDIERGLWNVDFESYDEWSFDCLPVNEPGVCYLPECSREFTPGREWAKFCCAACRRAHTNELRGVGMKIAQASLVAHLGKHAKRDTPEFERTRKARQYVETCLRLWREDRAERVAFAKERNADQAKPEAA